MLAPSFRHCWDRLFVFDGRTSRELYQPYANWVLVPIVAIVVVMALAPIGPVSGAFGSARPAGDGPSLAAILPLAILLVAAGLVLTTAATVRRLHDVGKSGWWFAVPTLLVTLKEVAWIDIATSPSVTGAKILSVTLFIYGLRFLELLGGFYLLMLLRRPGQPTDNRYGPPPPEEPYHPRRDLEAARVEAAYARLLRDGSTPPTARVDRSEDRRSELDEAPVDPETAREAARVDAAFARLTRERFQRALAPSAVGFGRKRSVRR